MSEQTAAYWLSKAENARAKADQMHDPSAKEMMMDIARKYDVMAQRAEGRESRLHAKKGPGPSK